MGTDDETEEEIGEMNQPERIKRSNGL